ncbi:pyridoxamine 5'-phosphate oxidase family protein [Porticoccaceae bacterium]|jgi:uncharacterized protein YhbP (UPF0306 family)|nr:pyridoxamine 5'-phosphate oxidase family protein [Porticoccaceae bacterium]MDA7849987.1 pyridoxamine 5'-phosphate oxidase family protein [Porticoccaceae bacterium]MDA8598767.1 pyridoxamine 5'-phosphate oxidase family protein [Porticoccaceae bacterium]MDA8878946.1 pyridoxamine 5'-phosphate oxidase family protein [Porticoccaceae bacterium]MDA8941686.1 pyridoxamine 5'-phosphate oxidase family protein [Porticoccaceae bacterium]|tara:strand:+ start:3211 stop:3696 length:486 start_codon:yes stop_codon:yes gene_type:complete
MSKDINKLHQFLHQESVLTLSTHDAEGDWSAPVLYVADTAQDQITLYFLSSANSRHTTALTEGDVAAASIYSNYTGQWQSIRGAQIQVSITRVDDAETGPIEALYFSRFPEIKALIDNPQTKQEKLIGAAFAKSFFYRAAPSFIRLTNNADSFAGRTEWQF